MALLFLVKVVCFLLFCFLFAVRSFMTSDDSGTLAFFDECVANADKPEPLITVTDSDK